MKGFLLTAAMVALFAGFLHFYQLMDYGKVLHNHRPGHCRVVEGPTQGSEDIEVIAKDGIAFVSSGLVYIGIDPKNVHGKIFLYDFSQPTTAGSKLRAKELTIKSQTLKKANFHPHGMSHWMVNGVPRLFVVNHDDDFKHSIEIFDYDAKTSTLIHKKTIKDDALIRPNDIAATGPDSFLFSNDGATQTKLLNIAEFLLSLKYGSIGYFDGQKFHTVLHGLHGSNGVTYDEKQNILYVSVLMDEKIKAFQMSKDMKSAKKISSTSVQTGADNLWLDSDGSIYTGAHPIWYKAAEHLAECENLKVHAPSQVLRLKYDTPHKPATVTEVYANDGTEASGSSAAVRYKNQLLVGTVCRQLVHCEIADPSVL